MTEAAKPLDALRQLRSECTRGTGKVVAAPALGLRERDIQWREAILKCARERGATNVCFFLDEYAPDRAPLKGASQEK